MRSCSGEHMPRKVPSPAGSLQYSPPPMEYPRNSNPNLSSSFSLLLPLIYATASSPSPTVPRPDASLRSWAVHACANRRIPALFLVSSGAGGGSNGGWREGDQGGPGGGAATAPGRGRAPAPRGALRRAVAVRVSPPLAGLCSITTVFSFLGWVISLYGGWFLTLCTLLAGSMRLFQETLEDFALSKL